MLSIESYIESQKLRESVGINDDFREQHYYGCSALVDHSIGGKNETKKQQIASIILALQQRNGK